MTSNPIIRKEVLSALRTKKAYLIQGLFLLVTVALVLLLWPEEGLQDIGGLQARRILSILSLGELMLIILFAPAFTAAALTSEAEHNTLESLFFTALKPSEIVFGKIVGALAFLIILVLSGLPALAMTFLLGGVSAMDILAATSILLLSAIYLGMIGFLVSTLAHRSYRSIIITYAVLLFVCFVAAAPAWPVSRNLLKYQGEIGQAVLHVIASLSPLEAMLSLVWPDSAYAQGSANMPPFWALFVPMSLALTCVMAGYCRYRLRRPPAPPKHRAKAHLIDRGVSARSFFFIIDPRRRKRPISWWQNPVLIKEFRTRPMLQGQWLMRVVGLCLIASVGLMFLVSISVSAFVAESAGMISNMATAVAAMMVVLVVMTGPAISAGTICADRETGVWDLMRATPLPSWRIVSGKFQASIIPLALLAIATLPALLILLFFNVELWPNILRVCYVIGMTIMFVATAGTLFSSLFSRTSTATAWTYALVVSLSMLTLLVLLAEDLFSRRFIEAVFLVNPVVAAMDAAGSGAVQKYASLNSHLKIMGLATATMFVVSVARVFQLRRAS